MSEAHSRIGYSSVRDVDPEYWRMYSTAESFPRLIARRISSSYHDKNVCLYSVLKRPSPSSALHELLSSAEALKDNRA